MPTWVGVLGALSLAVLAAAGVVLAATHLVAARDRARGLGPAGAQARAEEALRRALGALALALVALALFPGAAHAWTPGTHVYLGESVLANLHQLPTAIADLLRAFPYDFLYGNIAADTSMAKKYAPVGRHCHAWHVGQEILDLDRKSTRLNSSHIT